MAASNTQKVIALVIGLALVGAVGYYIVFQNNPLADIISSDVATTSQETAGQEILSLVDKLNSTDIDPAIFSSSLFLGLKDFTFISTDEPQGRANPFAPIGVERGGPVSIPSTFISTSTLR